MVHWDVAVEAAAKRLGEEILGELNALRNKLNDDKIAREVIAPALPLIQAERLGVDETTLRYLGAVVSGAIDGDGYVSAAMGVVGLTSGEHEIALLWKTILAAYGVKAEVRRVGSVFHMATSDVGAVKLAGLYFLYGSPLLEGGDEKVINYKLAEAVELGAEGLDIRWEGLRKTESGAAADLIISVAGVAVKYNVYLRNEVVLEFHSTNQSRAELAARLLRLAGVSAEVKRKEGSRGERRVEVSTNRLAAGHEKLRKALAEIVREAIARGWVDADKAGGWLEKLEKGRVLKEGWPRYKVRLVEGALEVRFASTDPNSIEREVQRFKEMGLEEGKHFSVKMPEGDRDGYVYVRREGLAYAAWLSVYGSGRQRELAAEFVNYILQRAWEEGEDVYRKAEEIVEGGKARGSLTLEGFEKEVEVDGKKHIVKVIGGDAEIEESRRGKPLLRMRITAEVGRVEGEHIVDRVVREYTITFSRRGAGNAAVGFATAKADAPAAERTTRRDSPPW